MSSKRRTQPQPSAALEELWIRLPLPPGVVKAARTHVDAVGELVTLLGALIGRGTELANNVERDVGRTIAGRKRRGTKRRRR